MRMNLDDFKARHRNPMCMEDLVIQVRMVMPVSDDEIRENVRINSRKDVPWLEEVSEAHDDTAIIVGKGPSLIDTLPLLRDTPGTVFALNAAAQFLEEQGERPDWQVFLDPHPNTVNEVGGASRQLVSSSCDPALVDACSKPLLYHSISDYVEECLPEGRKFVGIGGAITVLITAMCLAHTMGFRRFECHGVDSSWRDGKFYAFDSPYSEDWLHNVTVEVNGKSYQTGPDMKHQAVAFMSLAETFSDSKITVHGSGLLPDLMREKYGR
jgi:hypothetical protein